MSSTSVAEYIALQRAVAGRYSLVREIGRGGMGIVFLARDVALDRLVAIKLLPPELAANPDRRLRFLREARMGAGLSHPHIVPIHAVEELPDAAFFVMGYVDGETLASRLRRDGPLPLEEATRVMQEVAWALSHAHSRGVIHRDIKPDNILLERGTGRALVVDFGIGTTRREVQATEDGVLGTPRFMSPEQRIGAGVDGRTDIYSLGVTTWVALTGAHPHDQVSRAGRLGDVPSVRTLRPGVPAAVEQVLARCLAASPDERIGSAAELAEALRATRTHEALLSPPLRGWARDVDRAGGEIGSAAVAVTLALVLGLLFEGHFLIQQVYLLVAVLLFAIGAARFGELVVRARSLLAEGIGFEAASRALELDARATRDAPGAPVSQPQLSARAGATALLGAGKSGLLIWLVPRELPDLVWYLVIAGSVVVPAAFLRRLWGDVYPESHVLSRLMRGELGRLTFAAARVGQRGLPELSPITEPTMLAVGRGANELFRQLPAGEQQQLSAVPQVISRLQDEAVRLRREGDHARHEQVMIALESLRIELMRLHAGATQVGDVTSVLERARAIGDEVDRMVVARQEVDMAIERTPR